MKQDIDIVALQEPPINAFNNSIASKDWITIYPTTHSAHPDKTRTLTLIRSTVSTDAWEQLDFPSGDVTIILLKGDWGKLALFNIYNDGKSNNTIEQLKRFHRTNANITEHSEHDPAHIIWAGDFNRHHPHWDNPNDTRLFTTEALDAAEVLIEAVASLGLDLALPSGIPTHLHNVTKKWTRLDQVFISEHSLELIEACDTETGFRSAKTDHLPVVTKLNLTIPTSQPVSCRNFREVDWGEFRNSLTKHLDNLDNPGPISSQALLNVRCESLTAVIQATIEECVPTSEICSKSKRWWTMELTQMRKHMNKLGRKTCALRNTPEHPVHQEHAEAVKTYDRTLERTKRQHWRDWLERAVDPDIWTVHRVISAPASDGAKARIPALKHKIGDTEVTANTNPDKAKALAKSFFPAKPDDPGIPNDHAYPNECCKPDRITKEQIISQFRKLKPYKAPGPDGIPNIILTKCADLLTDQLYYIYKAMVERNFHYAPWKTFTTVVLRKPGKPRYDIPKAYRPIALLNTMWKVLAGIIADQITFYSEKYHLLPANHFGGRPGRTTTDAVLLITHKIKSAWRQGNVSSILFLDVEGAFPNAVPARLVHNLRKRQIPRRYTNFISEMLDGRSTRLKFDDHTSEPIKIDNGIGQGDPLSMVLYQFYNADILDIPTLSNESAIAYVDDALILATAKDFAATHNTLANMMTREGGIYNWSKTHNSPLEHSKIALIDFAHRNNNKERMNLTLPNIMITPSSSTKYLGVIIDQHLNWKAQHAYAIDKGTKWASQIRRVARPSWGITPNYARRLYIGVALPRILYGAEVWCGPPMISKSKGKIEGSSAILKRLATIQRSGALAITGALRTSPTDTLNACAFLLPAVLMVEKWCSQAAIRLASIPPEHPLYIPVRSSKTKYVKRHRTPLHTLFAQVEYDPRRIEKIPTKPRNPANIGKLPFSISIPTSKEASVTEDRNASETVKIYSDGSAHDGKVGAAATLTRPEQHPRTLHFFLSPETEHTVHEAELVGTILALHLINTEKRRRVSFAIGTDNQAALKVYDTSMRKPAHYAAREALRLGNKLRKDIRSKNFSLTLRWTAGHVGIPGNELADREAKRAAEGLQSDKSMLPVILRRKLTINPSAVKRSRTSEIKQTWVKKWRSSDKGLSVARIDKNTPSAHFLRRISNSNISRKSASMITQLLTEHIPLNAYLKRFKLVDNARCPACGHSSETVTHFLLHCPTYAHERWTLEKCLRKNKLALTLENLLGATEALEPLATYINTTHRFSHNP